LLIVTVGRNRVTSQERVTLDITLPRNLVSCLRERRIDTLVCGGLSPATRDAVIGERVSIIDNVACSASQVLVAIGEGRLQPGYGFGTTPIAGADPPAAIADEDLLRSSREDDRPGPKIDCLACRNRICLLGRSCAIERLGLEARPSAHERRMLEAAMDISFEEERQLCRLAELVYFCLEMELRQIGIAFCEELREPAEILDGVLRRSFETVPVGCRVGGSIEGESDESIVPPVCCSPLSQARVLNRAGTELNVIVGLCMGADCLFTQASEAPVTTLFVKDRSLANNPIGAAYSEYHLRESVNTPRPSPAWHRTERRKPTPDRSPEARSTREETR
jgi:uncharacterized metal-binding protein